MALVIALAFAASYARDNAFEAQVKNLPRRFQIGGNGYVLNEQEPGVIDDDAIVYTADAGARTFNFKTRTVLRHRYVGRQESFASLPQDERKETEKLARGALEFVRRLEARERRLSDVDQQHRELLRAFLANTAATQ